MPWPAPLPNLQRESDVLAGADVNPLLLRIVTGLVLVVVALAAVWYGGTFFTARVAAATLLMFAEWAVMHGLSRGVRLAGLALLAGVIVLLQLVTAGEALMTLGAGAALLGVFAARLAGTARNSMGRMSAAGILYCGLPAVALVWVRGLSLGLEATIFLLVCVWSADIIAFFVGRGVGGPKLAPAISPNKTWSGAIGGVVGAMLVAGGLAIAYLAHVQGHGAWKFIAVAGGLAGLSVLGDLFESHLKRRAGVKDSGTILPGHGGVMDRLDGLVPVAVAGAGVFAATGWAG